MIIIMKSDAPKQAVEQMISSLEQQGMKVQINTGVECTVLGVLGNTHELNKSQIEMNPQVERVMAVQEPFKKANRKFHPQDTVVSVGDRKIGDGELCVIAGPCSVESEEQIVEVAKRVKAAGAKFLRGGAFKPRSSPYAFQGLGTDGLELLAEAREVTGLPVVSELTSLRHLDRFVEMVDVIQIGARNMQNFELLRQVGRTKKPVLLKRGLASTIEELLLSAEYIMSEGNNDVILCERGIRTFETYTRNTLDLSAVPAIKRLSHLPVVVDPSHATGLSWMVEPMSIAAAAVGADGLIVEVHNDPACALCDGKQSITPDQFDVLMKKLRIASRIHQEAEQ
ncbi:MAG: 3-deoxy-7-phosphoheptulonate synthase [Clostridia bacterium]|nr:3-deoxy-7-phosphoheptulonate synthase [Clostridia bacterium]